MIVEIGFFAGMDWFFNSVFVFGFLAELAAIMSIIGAGANLHGQMTAKDPRQVGFGGTVQPPQDPSRFTQNLPSLITSLQNLRQRRY